VAALNLDLWEYYQGKNREMNLRLRLTLAISCFFINQFVCSENSNNPVIYQNFEVASFSELTQQGWTFIIGSDAFAEFSIANNGADNSKKCFAVDVLRLGQQNVWDIQLLKENISVSPGKLYQYSLWVKGNRGSNIGVAVETSNYYSLANETVVLTGEWQQVAIEFVPEQPYVRLPIHFSFEENFGSVIYVDELKLERAG